MPGWGGVENFGATVEGAASGWRTHFVAGEREEIAAEFHDVHRHVPGALSSVDQCHSANRARLRAQFRDRVDRA